MKKNFKFLTVAAVAFAIGLSANNFALSDAAQYKVGVVDVQKVVASSAQVKALKAEQRKRVDELGAFVKKAKTDLANQKDATKKQALEEKYNKELVAKKQAAEKDYAKKLVEIDKNITATIQKESKSKNYDLVLAKGTVLYGGEDMTETIIKSIK